MLKFMCDNKSKFFHIHWHYHNTFTVGLKEWMPEIMRCKWINFISQNE